ncbi:MAG TPA: VOC family protein [Patescibacteria group bacterium]|nr:VOC family protein [Patescibacteria group bacterium]
MKSTLLPYLNFTGKTREAMEFYKSIFGGELTTQTYAEGNPNCAPEDKDLTMHSELKTENFTFMAADGNSEHPVHVGDNISMSLIGSDLEQLTEWFNKLAEGGKADYPLAKAPWGDTFGMLTDKFGIHWMVNVSAKE